MNIRKPADYSNLFSELDRLMTAQPPQMELYYTYSYRIYLLCSNAFGAGSVFYIGNFEVRDAEMIAFYKRYAAFIAMLFCVCFVSEHR